METVTQIILTAITAAAGVVVALVGRGQVLRSKRLESEAAPYDSIRAEVKELKARVDALEVKDDRSTRVILFLLDERPHTLPLPQPVVDWLEDFYPHRLRGPYSNPTPSSIIEPPRSTP